jgi:C-terminal processing protease CtpA/Prc
MAMLLNVNCFVSGGKIDIYNNATETAISGIFIKHVVPNTPAGRNGTLKTGDRILAVSCMYDTISPVCHDHCLAYLQEISDLQMVSP